MRDDGGIILPEETGAGLPQVVAAGISRHLRRSTANGSSQPGRTTGSTPAWPRSPPRARDAAAGRRPALRCRRRHEQATHAREVRCHPGLQIPGSDRFMKAPPFAAACRYQSRRKGVLPPSGRAASTNVTLADSPARVHRGHQPRAAPRSNTLRGSVPWYQPELSAAASKFLTWTAPSCASMPSG